MNPITKHYRSNLIILVMITIAFILYLVSLKMAYPVFQNTRLLDPLAELHSLFPFYYIAIVLTALSGVMCFLNKNNNRLIHVIILLLLAIMIWYTRYYMAGFTWEPDSARNLGVSLNIPDILNGVRISSAAYGTQYPVAQILEYALFNILGTDLLAYLHLVPLLNIIIFTLLCYIFFNQFFSPQACLLAVLISILGMHYMIFIAGHHTLGVLLMLTVLSILWRKEKSWTSLSFAIIVIMIFCHPITPILLGGFIGAALLSAISLKNFKNQLILVAMLGLCLLGWYGWPKLYLALNPVNIDATGLTTNLVNDVLPNDLNTINQYAFGQAFIFKWIYSLNKAIYMIYGVLAIITISLSLYFARRRSNSWLKFLKETGGLTRSHVFLVISSMVFLVLTFLFLERVHDLAERGLTPLILTISGVVASLIAVYFIQARPAMQKLIASSLCLLVTFLAIAFPIVSYSIDAYSSFPISEKSGLEFVAEKIPLEDKNLVSSFSQQYILFQAFPKSRISLNDPATVEQGDVFVLRSTGYFYAALRFDYSFEDNRFTRYLDALNTNPAVYQIYYNPTTAVYLKR